MTTEDPGSGASIHKPRRPCKEIQDFLRDFGRPEHRNGAMWLSIDLASLPRYLRQMKLVQEARCWILVISSGGKVERYFERNRRAA